MYFQNGDILQNKYRLEQLIGRGGFAEVYRVTHLQLSAPRAVKALRQDAPGLAQLHEKDIVHRDLKPNNILFDAKVADLGLAQTPGGLNQRSLLGRQGN